MLWLRGISCRMKLLVVKNVANAKHRSPQPCIVPTLHSAIFALAQHKGKKMKNISHVTRTKAQIDFATFDLEGILRRLRNGTSTPSDMKVLASFSGTYLRYWQDVRELTLRGIIRK